MSDPRVSQRFAPWPALAVGLPCSLAAPAVLLSAGRFGLESLVGPMVFLVGAGIIAKKWPHRKLGLANDITLLRLIGTSWVAAIVAALSIRIETPARYQAAVIIIAATCLILDGLDGHVARKRGLASDFGARFDMETDAALLMVLSLAVPLLDIAGWWVLAIGAMRYAYVAASFVFPWLRIKLFESYARKIVAVVQGIALLLALTFSLIPLVPQIASVLILGIALIALCWSFGRDAVWQFSHR